MQIFSVKSLLINVNRSSSLNPQSFGWLEPQSFDRDEPSVVRAVSTLGRSGGMQFCILVHCYIVVLCFFVNIKKAGNLCGPGYLCSSLLLDYI